MNLKERLHTIIFEAETPGGRLFDVLLLWAIVLSVGAVIFESVPFFQQRFGFWFQVIEWCFTFLFTLEYIIRIIAVQRPLAYIFSFYGLIDLISILPTYLSLYFAGFQSLLVIRSVRMLRVFRILKLSRYIGGADTLMRALRSGRPKIIVFLLTVVSIALIMGTVMYLVEGPDHGFTSIPESMYWAIVTMTTVGYGDIAPQTVLGKMFASGLMLIGYAIIAVPTGIVSVEIADAAKKKHNTIGCPGCTHEGHDRDAIYCRFCGEKL